MISLRRSHPVPSVRLGHTKMGFFKLPFVLYPPEVMRHMHFLGRSGSGKSTTIGDIVVQLINQGIGTTLIDPHGDLATLVMRLLSEQGHWRHADSEDFRRIIYIDFSHKTRIPPMNVLNQPSYDDDKVATQLAKVCLRIWPNLESVGVTFLNIIKYSAYALIQAGHPLTAMERFLVRDDFRREVVSHATDPQIHQFFTYRFDRWRGKDRTDRIESTLNRVDLFAFSPRMRAILGQEKNLLNYRQLMDEGKTVIYNLAGLDEDEANFLAAFIFHGYERAAKSREDIPEDTRRFHMLFADEFQNFIAHSAKDFEDMLSESRKYRLFLGLANQHFGQMDNRMKQALQNAETFAFKLNRDDAVWMAPRFAQFNPKEEKHIVEDTQAQGRTHPVFTSMPEQFEKMARELEDLALGHCYVKFGTSVHRLMTRPYHNPTVTSEQLQPITDRYAEEYLVPLHAQEHVGTPAPSSTPVFAPHVLRKRKRDAA